MDLHKTLLQEGESPLIQARPSLWSHLMLRGLLCTVVGVLIFRFAYIYYSTRVVGIVTNVLTGNVSAAVATVLIVLAQLFAGYLLVVSGARLWAQVLPDPIGWYLLATVLVLPLVLLATWVSGPGNERVAILLTLGGTALPLVLTMVAWSRTTYALTDRRVLIATWPRGTLSIARSSIESVAIDQGVKGRIFGCGDIVFTVREDLSQKATLARMKGVPAASLALRAFMDELGLEQMRGPPPTPPALKRLARSARGFAAPLAVVVILSLVIALLPVFAVTSTVDYSCAYSLNAKGNNTVTNLLPYLHNVTFPVGHVHLYWYGSSGAWVAIGLIPISIEYESVALGALYPGSALQLTSSGSGDFTSIGGSYAMGCIAPSTGDAITMQFTYSSPILWG